MEIRKIKPEELIAAQRLDAIAFESPMSKEDDALTPEEYYRKIVNNVPNAVSPYDTQFMEVWGAFDENHTLCAKVHSLAHKMWFDGKSVRMQGIGGVTCMPTHRRRGLIRDIMRVILREENEAGVEFSYLYPFSVPFYERFGYALSQPEANWEILLNDLAVPVITTGFSLYDGSNLDAIKKSYSLSAKYNTMIDRGADDWRHVKCNSFTEKNYSYVCDTAHFSFMKDGRVMRVRELFFKDLASLKLVLGFAKSFASDYDSIAFSVCDALPLETLSAGGSLKRTLSPSGMVRATRPDLILKQANYIGSGSFVIRVTDDFLNLTYNLRVEHEDGHAVSVENTGKEPDFTCDLRLFAQAIIGRYSSEDLEFLGYSQLPRVFYKKPVFIKNYF